MTKINEMSKQLLAGESSLAHPGIIALAPVAALLLVEAAHGVVAAVVDDVAPDDLLFADGPTVSNVPIFAPALVFAA